MYTTFDKTIVGLIMAGVAVANYFGLHFGVSQDTVSGIVGVLTPILIYFVPNLPKDQA
jgi:hypothetical protein